MAIDVKTPIKYVPIKSKRFLCATCLEWCIELTPVLQRGMGQQFFQQLREARNRAILEGKRPPVGFKVQLRCPNGHHKNAYWTFHDTTLKRKKFSP